MEAVEDPHRSPLAPVRVLLPSEGRRGQNVSWFDGAGNGQPVDVEALFDSEVPVLVAGIVGLGAMVSIGTTSDGGALGITVTLDGRWRREYFRASEEAASWLLEAKGAVEAEAGSPTASPGPRQRVRRRKAV